MNLTKAIKRRLFNKRKFRKLSGETALLNEIQPQLPAQNSDSLRRYFLTRKQTLPGPAFDEKSLFLQLLERHFPAERTQILSQADQLGYGQLTLFQNLTVRFSQNINWHTTFANGQNWPLLPPDQIDCRSENRPGDVKLVWELNRHQFFHIPGKAFWYTGDKKYLHLVKHHLTDWIEKNPVGLGINWESTLEVSIRLVSWCWMMFYFQKEPDFFDDFFPVFLKSIFEHAEFVASNLTDWGNNHVIGESAGLWFAALVFPEFKHADRWQNKARAILETEILKQVTPDGVSRENSVAYHRFVLDFYLLALHAGRLKKFTFPETVKSRVREMLISLDTWCRPDHKFPRIGDDDSSQGLIFNPDPESAYFLTLGVGSHFFKTQLFNIRLIPNVLWFLGMHFQEIETFPPRAASAAVINRGGYLTFRSRRTPESDFALLNAAEMGLPPSFSHAHSDRLNIELSLRGIPILEDSGTFTYNGAGDWRNFFRSARAHNTLSINNSDQAFMSSTFGWTQPPKTEPALFCQNKIVSLMSGAYSVAAEHPAAGTGHRRLLLHLTPDNWLLIDVVTGVRGQISEYFQFPPENQLIREDTTDYRIRRSAKNFRFSFRSTEKVNTQIHFGDENFKGGWDSADYNIRQPRPTLEIRTETSVSNCVMNSALISLAESEFRQFTLDWLPLHTPTGEKLAPTRDLFGFEVRIGAMFVTLVFNVNALEIQFLDYTAKFPLWLRLAEQEKFLTMTGDFSDGNLDFFNEK